MYQGICEAREVAASHKMRIGCLCGVLAMRWGSDGAVAVCGQQCALPGTTREPQETNLLVKNHPRDITHVSGGRVIPGSSVAETLDCRAVATVHTE